MNNQQSEKQQLLLEYLISSPDTFAICSPILKADYFNPEYRKVVKFLIDYYNEYSSVPDSNQIKAETSVLLQTHTITKDQINYCSNEIERFCQSKGLEQAVIQASTLIGTNREAEISLIINNAVTISLNKDMGTQYFDNPLQRLLKNAEEPNRISTGWRDVDYLMGGGLARTEILLLSANSGGGKSISLANLAINIAAQGLNVVIITLEMSEKLVSQRFDVMFTGISTTNWEPHLYDIADAVEDIGKLFGDITIKRMMSGSNCNHIRSFLKEYEIKRKCVPDLLIVDYLDILNPIEKVSAENVSEKDKRSTEQFKDLLEEYNMMGATASQQTRGAIEAVELNQGHIAGGITKVNTVDWYISIIMNPTMKIAGEMTWLFLKSRSSDAVGKSVNFLWDNVFLRIKNLPKDSSKNILETTHLPLTTKKKSLKDIMVDL